MAYTAQIKVLLDVDSETAACDAMTAILTEQLRKYVPTSCLVDWEYLITNVQPVEVDDIPTDFSEGDDWPKELADMDGTEGQDRESYSDTQDRRNYS